MPPHWLQPGDRLRAPDLAQAVTKNLRFHSSKLQGVRDELQISIDKFEDYIIIS